MAENSAIEWTHHTYNPWRGCTKVSGGCKYCYADTLSKRNPQALGVWGPQGTRVVAAESYWKQPVKWNKDAQQAGERRRVFCASLADVFEGPETMPAESWGAVEAARFRLMELIDSTPWLDWLLLTKRPENVKPYLRDVLNESGFPPNVWIGTSVENQEQADKRIPILLQIPADVRFLSCEPLLGPVDLSEHLGVCHDCDAYMTMHRMEGSLYHEESGIHWVIAGGESGPNARPMHPDWARDLRDECQAADVPFFFKQWGEWIPQHGGTGPRMPFAPEYIGKLHNFGDGWGAQKVGKKAAGRLLDGREWNEYPAITQSLNDQITQ